MSSQLVGRSVIGPTLTADLVCMSGGMGSPLGREAGAHTGCELKLIF